MELQQYNVSEVKLTLTLLHLHNVILHYEVLITERHSANNEAIKA